MSVDLDELARLEAAATPGPWFRWKGNACVLHGNPIEHTRGHVRGHLGEVCEADDDSDRATEDAELIAAARNALPDLIAEIRALRARLALADEVVEREQKTRGCHCLMVRRDICGDCARYRLAINQYSAARPKGDE